MAMFPWMSPYVAFDNNPVFYVDPLGLAATNGGDKGKSKNSSAEKPNPSSGKLVKYVIKVTNENGDVVSKKEYYHSHVNLKKEGVKWKSIGEAEVERVYNQKGELISESLVRGIIPDESFIQRAYPTISNSSPNKISAETLEKKGTDVDTYAAYLKQKSQEQYEYARNLEIQRLEEIRKRQLSNFNLGNPTMMHSGAAQPFDDFWLLFFGWGGGTGAVEMGTAKELSAASIAKVVATRPGANLFDDIVANPSTIWGKSADEVGSMLGEGWTKGTYGSKGTGWKFTNGDRSIFYHPGGGVHKGSYFGYSSGKLGKNKIVGSDYIPIQGDKARIIKMGN